MIRQVGHGGGVSAADGQFDVAIVQQPSAEEVRVVRERSGGLETVWTSPTAFTRVGVQQTGRYGLQVRLMLSNRRYAVGAFLGPKERGDLAEALQQAIKAARAERHPS